ncbi:MAG: ribosomal L7Ae/L30e/S12e/Gadd45 family protein [Candidatus Weimeria sp.]|nr:ribosomal L7Ae/L30e/S12e/Gadd45 family protein [Candidatus Weimeria sp.]
MTDPIFSMLGLAQKAGRIASGEFSAEKAVKEKKAYLVIIAEDASDNTKKHFTDMCTYRKIPYRIYGQSSELGPCLGKAFRMTVAVCDAGFAGSIIDKIDRFCTARRNLNGENQST